MKYMLIRVCAMMLAVCLCLSTGGCTNQEAPSSGTISSSQNSSSNSGSQPDLVGSSQAPLPEAQPTISAPTISIEKQT